jgi:hypothetical protein
MPEVSDKITEILKDLADQLNSKWIKKCLKMRY